MKKKQNVSKSKEKSLDVNNEKISSHSDLSTSESEYILSESESESKF